MDAAIPLGSVVNELVSNSLKYASPGMNNGEIQIKLFKNKDKSKLSNEEGKLTGKGIGYTLIISDDGADIPDNIDLENSDTPWSATCKYSGRSVRRWDRAKKR